MEQDGADPGKTGGWEQASEGGGTPWGTYIIRDGEDQRSTRSENKIPNHIQTTASKWPQLERSTYTHAHAHTHTHARTHTNIYTETQTCTHRYRHARTHRHTSTLTQEHTDRYTHRHTYTHVLAQHPTPIWPVCFPWHGCLHIRKRDKKSHCSIDKIRDQEKSTTLNSHRKPGDSETPKKA